jgi:pimeloyl-ACP methyl ester carboxylesterase
MVQLQYINIAELIAAAGGDPWAINNSLQSGRPAQIASLAQAFHSAGQSAHDADAAFDQAKQRFEKAWNRESGEHPINDSAEVQRVTQTLQLQGSQLSQIGADLETIAAALAEAQKSADWYISALDHDLEVIDCEIGEALADDEDPDALCEEAVYVTKAALAQLEHIRDGYSGTLQGALAHLRTDGADPAEIKGVDELLIPPPGTSPQEVNRWWNSLSDQQKHLLIDQHPPELGNLNGIPTDARSDINEAVMHDDITRVESAAAQHHVSVDQVTQHPELYGLTPTAITRYTNAVQTRNGLRMDSYGGKNQVFLQTYDPEAFNGRGRAAIAIGNPDKAVNTTVLVPGTGESVQGGYLSHPDGLNIYTDAQRADLGRPTSVLVWMGYHTPDSLLDPHVGQPTLAREGGSLLARDVNALGVTHTGASHVTVIGHSYGSTTVADAAAGSGMRANDVVLVGSPGTDLAKSAADFHLPQGGHVYVGSASSDPITHLGGIQEHVPGTGVTVGLGNDPAVEGYGSTRFKAEAPGATLPWKDHSSYFTRGSESLFSIGDIVSGHGDALAHDHVTAPHRGSYWLPDDIDPESFRPGTGGHAH